MSSNNIDSNTTHQGTIRTKLNRRKFIKQTAIVSAGALAGVYGLKSFTDKFELPDWTGKKYPGVILMNFNLFDGINNKIQKGLKILIEGDKIIDIVKEGEIKAYKNFKEVDLKGHVLMPGLIDNHVHITVPFMYSINLNSIQQMDKQILLNFRNCVMNGVTTVRDVGGFPGKINKYGNLSEQNKIPGPRVISSLSPIAAREGDNLGAPEKAPYFTNPVIKWILGGNYAERPTNIKEIERATEEMLGLGARWIKTLNQEHTIAAKGRPLPNHTDNEFKKILEIGRAHGIKSALHAPLLSGFMKGVDLGYNTQEHMVLDKLIPEKYIEKFNQNGMAVMPTMMIYGDEFKVDELLTLISEKGNQYVTPEAIRQMLKRLEKSKANTNAIPSWDSEYMKLQFPVVTRNLQRFYKMGAVIGAGSDIGGTMSGFFGRFTDELEHYIQSGISNFDALRMATSVNAQIIDMQDNIGTVKKGLFADLIAVEGNPLNDIKALKKVKMVMKGGVFIKYDKLIS